MLKRTRGEERHGPGEKKLAAEECTKPMEIAKQGDQRWGHLRDRGQMIC